MNTMLLANLPDHSYFILENKVYEKLSTMLDDKLQASSIHCIGVMYWLSNKWYFNTGGPTYSDFSPNIEVIPCTYFPIVNGKPYTPPKKLEKWQIEYYRYVFLGDDCKWCHEAVEEKFWKEFEMGNLGQKVFESIAAINFKRGWDAAFIIKALFQI